MRPAGKVALITGAAMGNCGEPMGIGGATAWVFAREGTKVKVALSDVNEPIGRRAADQLRDRGYSAIFVPLDVTSEADWIRAVCETMSTSVTGSELVIDGGFSSQ
jgi:NAD(P)-dependent dehydrogenase (short-subunit alcohol dehydrogenase family)